MTTLPRQFPTWFAREPGRSRLSAGDWVRVRSREEILATLDARGRLDGMPFMPEMLAFCGRRLRVTKRAHKTCDTICVPVGRRLENTVHLDVRCDGSAHGGCEAACSMFWNEAWLEPEAEADAGTPMSRESEPRAGASGCTLQQLIAATQDGYHVSKGPRYACQSTHYLNATQPLSSYDPRQYIEDYRSGNVDVPTLLRGAMYRVASYVVRRLERIGRRLGIGALLARAAMASYDALQRLLPDGVPYPRRQGTIPSGQPTPHAGLGPLRPGSRVRVKPYREILATLNADNRTRGLYFDAEHVPYCGKEFSVLSVVNRVIDEHTGYMVHFKSPSIILEGVRCQGTYSDGRMFCPRESYPFWRTIWLVPVEGTPAADDALRH